MTDRALTSFRKYYRQRLTHPKGAPLASMNEVPNG